MLVLSSGPVAAVAIRGDRGAAPPLLAPMDRRFRAALSFRFLRRLVAILLLIAAMATPLLAQTPPAGSDPAAGAEPRKEPEYVLTGVYLIDLWRMDLVRGLFDADFYIWFSWKGERFNPSGVEFMNAERLWQFRETDKVVQGDKTYVTYRVSGTFKGSFDLSRYPFDSQVLELQVEDQALELQDVVLLPDSKMFDGTPRDLDRGSRERVLHLPGWQVTDVRQIPDTHTYHTDWGGPFPTGESSRYSRYTFAVTVAREVTPYIMKFLLPLVVIVLIAFLVFFIEDEHFGAQVGLGLLSFLSAVIYHAMQSGQLPDVGYLVLIDKFFILSYAIIFLTLVQTVVAHHLHRRGATERATMLDSLCRVLFPVLYVAGVGALLLPNL